MSDVLYGFDSGLSLSFVHTRIIGAIGGLLTGGPAGAVTGFISGGGSTAAVPGATTDRCGNPSFVPGEPVSVSEARFRCANPAGTVTINPPFVGDPGIGISISGGGVPGTALAPQTAPMGFVSPVRSSVAVDKCPRFADGATGILWMSALTGQVVCLPRRANGTAFGLIRKNKPRRKPFISAAQKKQLDSIAKVQNKAKAFATAAGFKCTNTVKRVKGTSHRK